MKRVGIPSRRGSALVLGGVFLLTAGPAIVTGTTSSGATATSIEAAAKSREAAQIPVIEAVNTDADNFGGVYLDGTGTLVIQYVDANAGRAAIEKLIGPGVPVRWEAVTRSQSALLGLKDQVVKAWPDGVYSVGLDTTSNEVNVTVLPDASVAAIRSSLPTTGVNVVQAESTPEARFSCVSRTNCTRWRGGIRTEDTFHACTWGFQASRNGNLHMVEAGHCAAQGAILTHNGATIGSPGVGKNALALSNGIDVLRSRVDGSAYPTTQNTLYATDAIKSWQLDSVRTAAGFAVGQTSAKSGITTGYTWGRITQINVSYILIPGPGDFIPGFPGCDASHTSQCPHVLGINTDVPISAGDSGGPVFNWYTAGAVTGTTLEGFASGETDGKMTFATAAAALPALDLDFWCLTPGCP